MDLCDKIAIVEFKKLVIEKYSQDEEIKQYKEDAKRGLFVWEERVLKRFLKGNEMVLVLGCGCGREVFGLERMGVNAVGIDISISQLRASMELRREFSSTSNFLAGDCLDLPFKSSRFDACVLYRQFIQHFPGIKNRKRLVDEIVRVLTDDGLLFLSVNLSPFSIGFKRLINFFYRWRQFKNKEQSVNSINADLAPRAFLFRLGINILGAIGFGLRRFFRSLIRSLLGRFYKGPEPGDYLISNISGAKSNGRIWFHSYTYNDLIKELAMHNVEILEIRDIAEIEQDLQFPELVRKGARFVSVVARKKR